MVPEPLRHPGLRRAAALAALCLVAGLLAGHKAWLLRSSQESLYQVEDDYAALALGHGINLDFWGEDFPGPRSVGYYQTTHPGIPFQAVSGLVYQLAHEPGRNARERALRTLIDPARFWKADRIAVLVLFLASLCAAFAATWREHGFASLLVPLATLAYAPAWPYYLDLVGNETFALPLFLALWLAMRKALAPELRPWAFFLAGAVGGVAYLNKMNYVAWLLAAVLALTLFAVRTPAPAGRKALALSALAIGAVASVLGLGVLFLGWDGFATMLDGHKAVFANTGHFGLGEAGVVKLAVAWENFKSVLTRDAAFTAWLLVAIAFVVYVLVRRWREGELSLGAQAMALFLVASSGIAFLAAMKHYFPRYLVPALAALPFAVLSFGRRLPAVALAALLLGTAALDARVAMAERARVEAQRDVARVYQEEVGRARALPVSDGQFKIWTYKARAPEYGASFVVENSNHLELYLPFYLSLLPRDRGLFRDFPLQLPWEYVVYTKDSYASYEQVPAPVRLASDIAYQGEYLLVLRRKGG